MSNKIPDCCKLKYKLHGLKKDFAHPADYYDYWSRIYAAKRNIALCETQAEKKGK